MYKIRAHAKINLCLDITGKRIDGYHEIRTVMKETDLSDILFFDIRKRSTDEKVSNIYISSNKKFLPVDNRNLCFKAIQFIKKEFTIDDDIYLHIQKNIPVSAGLGGGSSDFYSTLKFLNKYYNLKLSKHDLVKISNNFGSDMAFFSIGKTCLCEGRGEILTPLPDFRYKKIHIYTPNISVSTKEIFQEFDNTGLIRDSKKNIDNVISGIINSNPKQVIDNCFNVLENVTVKKYPVINNIKEKNYKHGALLSLMSGSGPSVFFIK